MLGYGCAWCFTEYFGVLDYDLLLADTTLSADQMLSLPMMADDAILVDTGVSQFKHAIVGEQPCWQIKVFFIMKKRSNDPCHLATNLESSIRAEDD